MLRLPPLADFSDRRSRIGSYHNEQTSWINNIQLAEPQSATTRKYPRDYPKLTLATSLEGSQLEPQLPTQTKTSKKLVNLQSFAEATSSGFGSGHNSHSELVHVNKARPSGVFLTNTANNNLGSSSSRIRMNRQRVTDQGNVPGNSLEIDSQDSKSKGQSRFPSTTLLSTKTELSGIILNRLKNKYNQTGEKPKNLESSSKQYSSSKKLGLSENTSIIEPIRM